ncbi:MAG: YncE family protein, partial [Microthrixaceae bacterium]|nr:YncE family protein [Microthrixaceae bacterium]
GEAEAADAPAGPPEQSSTDPATDGDDPAVIDSTVEAAAPAVLHPVPSDQRQMAKLSVITDGPLTPKSIEASANGLFFAQNMMYSHTITVYDRSFALVKSIPDSINPADWGYPDHAGTTTGSPVEMAFSHDGTKAYVSNYEMSGPGFSNPGNDKCSKGSWDNSYLYRVDTASLEIDQVIEVGPVPKYVAVTPDDATVLTTNWCGYDLSVVDAATGKETRRIPIGRFPRGIAVMPDNTTVFVAVMGTKDIAVVNLVDDSVQWITGVGQGPRHLVLDPAGEFLYATLNGEGKVAKIDVATRTVVAKVASPSQPRSMTIAPDGRSLYVVNYDSDAVSKIRTSDMTQIQRLPTGHHPIGITYDRTDNRVWVACYGGSLYVFDDTAS